MDKFIIYTQAFNSDKTLKRTIESVLRQTDDNFIYYILDNGSNDNTGEIIAKYAGQDSRIVPLRNEINNVWLKHEKWLSFLNAHNGDCLFTMLDADDEYAPDFFEKMRIFVTDNHLDAAACGTDWIDEETGEIIKHKVLTEDLVLEGREFADKFPVYRNFMVTLWSVVFYVKIFRECNYKWAKKAMNFSDTALCMEVFHRAKRAGVLAESLHKYYTGPKTGSYIYNPKWFHACKTLCNISRQYLRSYGPISRQNKDYLCVLFLTLIKYILPRIQGADVELAEKLKRLHEIFKDKKTWYMLQNWSKVGIYSDKGEFLREIKSWITSQGGWESNPRIVNKIFKNMDMDNQGKGASWWIFYQKRLRES
jgi:glycosyltransferase involved in cell wall biosynthesis